MNRIILKKSTHRNFMSYGDIPNEFTFPNGIVLMTAANGCGKSTIIEVINFALFGTSYRGGNKGELRNTNNSTAVMEVSLEFDVDHGNDDVTQFRLFRSISPKGTMKFELERLDDGKWIAMNKRAGFTQKDFEDKILGFNEVLFKNVIAMNTQESTPFIDMPAAKRRELLESIIDMSTEYWKKESGRLLSAASTACEIAASDIERINGDISTIEHICETLRAEKHDNIEQLKDQLGQINDKIRELNADLATRKAAMDAKMAEINQYSAEAEREKSVDSDIARLNAASRSLEQLETAKNTLSSAQLALEQANNGYDAAAHAALRDELAAGNAEIDQKMTERQKIVYNVGREEMTISQIGTEMDKIAAQGKQLKPGVPCPTCGKPSTAEDIEPHRQELLNKWKTMKADKAAHEEAKLSLDNELATVDGELKSLNDRMADAGSRNEAMQQYLYGTLTPAQNAVAQAERNLNDLRAQISSAGVDIDQIAAELARLQAEKAGFSVIREKWQSAYNQYTVMSTEYGKVNGDFAACNAEQNRLAAEIDKAERASDNDSLAIAEGKLADAKADLESAQSRLSEQSDLKAGYAYISKNLCSDDGMKKMLFGLFVPAFNKSVQKNLVHAGLPFSMEFDDTMSYNFISAPGLAPSYSMLSQGQRRKLGFAISMAFRDFVAMVGNFSINLLSLDEVIDQSTDDNAMRDMMDLVRSMSDSIGCALVITHRVAAVMDKFDYWVTIEHDGMFSSIGEMKKL